MPNTQDHIPFAAMMITAGLGTTPDSIIKGSRDMGVSKLKENDWEKQ